MDSNLKFITSSKLFSTVFDEEMKARGFRRKGHLYYKVVGDFIQGVVLKTVNPYSICFHAYPYWSEPSYFFTGSRFDKGHWAEFGMEISPSRLFGGYYKKENVEINTDAMVVCLELAKEHFLPITESVKDYDSYLKYKSLVWPEKQFDNIFMNEFYIDSIATKYREAVEARAIQPTVRLCYARPDYIDQYVYLYKCFLEGSFDNTYKLMMSRTQEIVDYYTKTSEESRRNELIQRYTSDFTSVFVEKMKSNDLSWIENYRLERKKIIDAKLAKELSIKLDSL